MKKSSLIGLAFLGIIFLSGCGNNSTNNSSSVPRESSDKKNIQPVYDNQGKANDNVNEKMINSSTSSNVQGGVSSTQEDIFYANNDYGFKLKLPNNWKNYKVVITKNSVWEFTKTGEKTSTPIKCPDCATFDFFLPYDSSWKLHQSIPKQGEDVRVMSLLVKNIETWNTLCKTYCKNDDGPSCIDCEDYLMNNDKYSFSSMFTVEFPDDISPETKDYRNSANEFFKNSFSFIQAR